MKVIDVSVRRPVTVFILAVAAVIFGGVGFRQLATDLLPDVTYPSLTVRTLYPGAAPVEVESLVTRPVENAVGVVNGLIRVESSSRAGVSEVTLELAWGTEMDFAALDVRERLDVVQLPDDAEAPILLRYDPSLDPILRLGLSRQEPDEGLTPQQQRQRLLELRRLAEDRVQRRLERIDGVAAAQVQGGLEEEIQVELDERRLANLGLDVDRVLQRLAQENVDLTGGRLEDGQTEYLVRTLQELLRPEDLRELVIDASRGAVVRLGEVAEVRQGARERQIVTRVNGRESVEIAIYKAGGTNTVTVSQSVQDALTELEAQLRRMDPSLRLTVITDQARFIRQAVRDVLETAAYGGVLAILVLLLFLRSVRATVIIGVAIPISVIATFFLMYLSGISLNIMSLGGLTLGVGLLVDNAIVVLEAVERQKEKARKAGEALAATEAARLGAGTVATAIVASTLTSICVFLPIVFVEGVAAQFFSDQALTVTYSLVLSLLVALTVIPMAASRELRRRAEASGYDSGDEGPGTGALFRGVVGVLRGIKAAARTALRPFAWGLAAVGRVFDRGLGSLGEIYDRALSGVLGRPAVTLLVAFLLLSASLLLVPLLGVELVPELVQGEFFLEAELPPGTRLEVTERRLTRLEEVALGLDGVDSVYTLVGSTSQQGGTAAENRENRGQITVTLQGAGDRAREDRLIAELRRAALAQEDLEVRFGRPTYFSFRTPIELELRGNNLVLLERLAERLAERLTETSGFADVESSTEGGNPELQIRFDRQRLAALGLSVQQVAAVVQAKVQGEVPTEIQRQDRTIDIRLRAAETFRDSARDLKNLVVVQRGATALPLSAVADVTEAEGPAEIRRVDGERAAILTANLDGLGLEAAAEEIEAAVAELGLPRGFDWDLGGQQREMETSFASMRLALLLAVFLVYLVMASQFESLLHPFVILFSVPLAAVGVIVTLWLFDLRISLVVLIGVVLLAGIVVNNAIILVDYTNQLRRRGLATADALRRAGHVRLRPILMTTTTTVLGLLPMALEFGEGSELRSPMALTVIGGLLSSSLLTLLVIPAAYRLLDRREHLPAVEAGPGTEGPA